MMTYLLTFSFAVLGAILASFVGVIAERVNTGQSWMRGRSRCNSCAQDLTGKDLVPVLSYLVSRGRCFACRARIPVAYVALELLLALVFGLAYAALGLTPALPVFLLSVLVLAFIVVYDLRHTIVPTSASLTLVSLSFLFALMEAETIVSFGLALFIAGLIGSMFFLLFFFSRGRAMGLGDAPVALALSLLIAPYAFGGLLLSFWIGAVYGIAVLVLRRGGPRMGIEVPFVPFLALGYLIAYFAAWNPALITL